jgi:hypothetical protein
MKKNVGCRVQLEPTASRLDDSGRELPSIDDDWIIEDVSTGGVRVRNARTEHVTTLGKDHIHHFTSNPDRSQGGIPYGFLTLNVQVFLQGNKLWVRPSARPGEPVEVARVDIVEKWVDSNYPYDSGVQQRLEAAAYRVAWCPDTKLSRRIDLEGWEIVVEPDAQGVQTKFRLKDPRADKTLIKKRNG